jgi:hypothetical protein
MNYPVTLIIPAGNVGAVEAGKWQKICMGMWIKATYSEPFTLAAALLGSMSNEEILRRLMQEVENA